MRVFIIFLKVVMLVLTAIYGVFLNILGGVGYTVNGLPQIGIPLLVTTAVCFIGGTVLVICGKTIPAGILAVIGIISIFVLKSANNNIISDGTVSASELFTRNHMPSVGIGIVIIGIALILNKNAIRNYKEEKYKKENAPTTSVITGKEIKGKQKK